LLIDTLANRYHCLPSEIVARGDTLDVYIITEALKIRAYYDKLADAKASGKVLPMKKKYTQEELKAIVERSKQHGS